MSICRVLAIDPSLTQSGWAVFSVKSTQVESWGVIPSISSQNPLTMRLKDLQVKIRQLFEELAIGRGDYLVCEGPAPISLNPSSSIKVEQVRGIFEAMGRERGVSVLARLNPRTVQSELMGIRGKQLPRAEVKKIARQVICSLFPALSNDKINLEQDAIDAMLIGVLAQARIARSIQAGMDPCAGFEFSGKGPSSSRGRGSRGLSWPDSALVRKGSTRC